MSTKNDGGPAFPQGTKFASSAQQILDGGHHGGMTLRDYFAAKAMQAILYETIKIDGDATTHRVARDAYRVAEAMLKAREQ